MPVAYEERFYRRWVTAGDLVSFEVCIGETDLAVQAGSDLSDVARDAALRARRGVETAISLDRRFLAAMQPLDVPPEAPGIARDMADAARIYGVGPMAAVAGAVAQAVGRDLLEHSRQVIVENGGDIWMQTHAPRRVTIYAGPLSPFSGKLSLIVPSAERPVAVCTSSGTVGHSTSFGRADAVVALADCAALADAAATAVCNTISGPEDVQPALDHERERGLLRGLLIAIGDRLGAWGEIELA